MNTTTQQKKLEVMLAQVGLRDSDILFIDRTLTEYKSWLAKEGADPDTAESLAQDMLTSLVPGEALRRIRVLIKHCTRCPGLGSYCPGDGPPTAQIVFVGEAPGAAEEQQHKPFVGPAGKLLDDLLKEHALLSRAEVYVTNTIRCRPPENRDPTVAESRACLTYLWRELAIIKPLLVVTLGNVPTRAFLPQAKTVGEARGRVYRVTLPGSRQQVRVMPTYHPAVTLHSHKEDYEGRLAHDFQRIPYLAYHPEADGVEEEPLFA